MKLIKPETIFNSQMEMDCAGNCSEIHMQVESQCEIPHGKSYAVYEEDMDWKTKIFD